MALGRSTLESFAEQLSIFLRHQDLFRIVWSSSPKHWFTNDGSTIFKPTFTTKDTPGTLFILDSSFNPPTRAHLSLALSAINHKPDHESRDQHLKYYARPYRLLLLFSVHNATKAPAPAAFEHRLAMMQCAAMDFERLLLNQLDTNREHRAHNSQAQDEDQNQEIDIDIGITKEPYYHDKIRDIDTSIIYTPIFNDSNSKTTAPGPKHVHLIGWDTFMRVLDPKYYQDKHDPPLGALDEFFTRHGLLVTLRPESASGDDQEVQRQQEMLQRVRSGERSEEGLNTKWFTDGGIRVMQPSEEQRLVSSTAVRKAVEEENWGLVERYCTPSVRDWVRNMKPYGGGEKL